MLGAMVLAGTPPVQSATSTSTTGGTLAAATYFYVVTALGPFGETIASNERSQVTTGSTSTVSLNWTAVPEATGYKIYRSTTTGIELLLITLTTTALVCTDTGALTPAGASPPTNTGVTPDWHGENERITERDVDFGEVSLLPSTMKSVKTLTRFSNELARQAVIQLDAALKQRLVTDVVAKLDAQLFSATGDGVTLRKGMLAWTGVQSFSASSAAINYDLLIDMWAKALIADVDTSSLRYFMHPRQFVALRKIKAQTSGSNQYLVSQDVTADAVMRAWGSQVANAG
jgi:HK97 family phage major capsid protein